MAFYNIKKNGNSYDIPPDLIEDFAGMGFSIYKTIEVEVEDVKEEIEALKKTGEIS